MAEIPDLPERIARLESGESPADTELDAGRLDAGRLVAAGQDVRAYYEEAGLQLADVTGARQLETWFVESTEAGRLLVRVSDRRSTAGRVRSSPTTPPRATLRSSHHRPHGSTPAVAYHARSKAEPGNDHPNSESRVRRDRVHTGNISLRVDGHMHHIGVGRTLDGTPVLLLINGYDVRVIHATTGEIIRTLTINPERRYHGTGNPTGGPKGPRKIKRSGP